MTLEILIANTLRLARQDLDAARLLVVPNNRYAVYHCEQAAEKIIKAVLSAEGKHAGVRHDLDELVDLIPDENPLKPCLRATQALAAYATAFRYVTATGRIVKAPAKEEVLAHIERVATALNAAATAFQADLDTTDTPARRPAPPRAPTS